MKKHNRNITAALATAAVFITMAAALTVTEKLKDSREQNRAAAQPFKLIRMGTSLAYPTEMNQYPGVLEATIKQGAKQCRFYDPFIKGDTTLALLTSRIKYLFDRGADTIMITLGNIPYNTAGADTIGMTLTAKQRSIIQYTNRCYPKDTARYARELKRLCDSLVSKKFMPKIQFEMNDEVNADIYFFGTFEQAKSLNLIKYGVLKKYGVKIYQGSYTSELMSDTTWKHNGRWYDYIDQDTLLNLVAFSHSFYWTASSKVPFNTQENDYPRRTMSEIVVTEYGMYTGFDAKGIRDSTFNSPEYIKKWIDFLTFVYDKPVTKIFIHPLCEYEGRYETKGPMGIWKKNYSQEYHTMYYTIKPAGTNYYKLLDVIKNGYRPIPNGIQGTAKTITWQNNNFTITNN